MPIINSYLILSHPPYYDLPGCKSFHHGSGFAHSNGFQLTLYTSQQGENRFIIGCIAGISIEHSNVTQTMSNTQINMCCNRCEKKNKPCPMHKETTFSRPMVLNLFVDPQPQEVLPAVQYLLKWSSWPIAHVPSQDSSTNMPAASAMIHVGWTSQRV